MNYIFDHTDFGGFSVTDDGGRKYTVQIDADKIWQIYRPDEKYDMGRFVSTERDGDKMIRHYANGLEAHGCRRRTKSGVNITIDY